jgi:hypothetical protein
MLLTRRPMIRHLFFAAGLASLAACAHDLIAPGGGEQITVSGTLTNKTNQPLPSGTRVLVAWEVSSGSPDYMYVFGEGTIQEASNSFNLSFDGPPPARALNSYGLGVGMIFLTTNTSLKVGSDPQSIPESEIIGAAGQHSVIFLDRNPAELGTNIGWVSRFKRGYNVG